MPRVACTLEVRAQTRTGWVPVKVLDLSRRGVRIAISDQTVGLSSEASLLDVARRLGGVLPEWIPLEFPTHGGLSRKVRVVRIGKRSGDRGEVELGCLFAEPLQDLDALQLGVVLPDEGESWEQAERRQEKARSLYAPQPEAAPKQPDEGGLASL
jgi:hypothetical protein